MISDRVRTPRKEKYLAGWRVLVGRALLLAAVSIAVLSAWSSQRTVHAFSRAEREQATVLFKQTGCEHCHGVDGVGTARAPSLTAVGKRLSRSQIEEQIKNGGQEMPPFGDVLSQDETNELVDYLVHQKKLSKGAAKI